MQCIDDIHLGNRLKYIQKRRTLEISNERTSAFFEKVDRISIGTVVVADYKNNNTTATLRSTVCGHTFTRHPRSIKSNSNEITCTVCSPRYGRHLPKPGESFADIYPDKAKEWDYEKNNTLPFEHKPHTNYDVHWVCSVCTEGYPMTLAKRAEQNCPYCAGKIVGRYNNLKYLFPELAKEYSTKNPKLAVEITPGSSQKVIWEHTIDNVKHEWEALVYSRTRSNNPTNCPDCNKIFKTSFTEMTFRSIFSKVLPNVASEPTTKVKGMEIDIYPDPELRIGIEIDGYLAHKYRYEKDKNKNESFAREGIIIIRIRDCRLEPVSDEYDIPFVFPSSTEQVINTAKGVLVKINKLRGTNYTLSICSTEELIPSRKELLENYKKQCIGELHPELLEEWDYVKNKVCPSNVRPGSENKHWWKCSSCNHSWDKSPYNRIRSMVGCPKCYSLGGRYPELEEIWDEKRNGDFNKMYDYAPNSTVVVYWICPCCTESYPAKIVKVTSSPLLEKKLCPECTTEQLRRKKLTLFTPFETLKDEQKRELVNNFLEIELPLLKVRKKSLLKEAVLLMFVKGISVGKVSKTKSIPTSTLGGWRKLFSNFLLKKNI